MKHPPPPVKKQLEVARTESIGGKDVPIYREIPREAKCKECGNEPRKPGSSRGEKCTHAFKVRQLDQERLQKKIEQQTNTP